VYISLIVFLVMAAFTAVFAAILFLAKGLARSTDTTKKPEL